MEHIKKQEGPRSRTESLLTGALTIGVSYSSSFFEITNFVPIAFDG